VAVNSVRRDGAVAALRTTDSDPARAFDAPP